MCLAKDPEESVNLAEDQVGKVVALLQKLHDLTADFEIPTSAMEDSSMLTGDTFADSVAVASGNVMTPWVA